MDRYRKESVDNEAIVNLETGELKEYTVNKKIDLEGFIMVFFDSCPLLMDLTGEQLKVLMCCWRFSSYDPTDVRSNNIIHNDEEFKGKCWGVGLRVHPAAINRAISVLCKKRLLIKRCKGEYILNTVYFFRGRLRDRETSIKTLFEGI